MLNNYFKIAFRNIFKYKLHSFINIFGLAVGFASSIIIFLYANCELTFDAVHGKAENIYQVYKERITPAGTQLARDTWFPMAKTLKDDFPGVEKAAHYFDETTWLIIGNKKFEETVTYASNELFDIFTLEFVKGRSAEPFKNINSAYITETLADKYFGNENPIGKNINIDYQKDYTISGVIKDLPANSTLQINFLVSSESINNVERQYTNWSSSFLSTYILLNHNTSKESIEKLFPDFIEKTWDKQTRESTNFKLTPLLDLHNEETDSNQKAFILIAIALGILLIASINFVNLTTARSIERAKEIGLRKVIGASKLSLIQQFLSESLLLVFISLIAGLIIVEILLPNFNSLYNLDLHISYLDNPIIILQIIALSMLIGLFSGLYPAFYLSKLKPVDSLKGENRINLRKINLRQLLVTSQFAISVVLIIGTIIMWQQINFMRTADLNFDKEQLVTIPITLSDFKNKEAAQTRLESLKNELRKNSNIISVASSSHVPGMWQDWFTFVYPSDRNKEERLRMRIAVVDDKYFETFGIKFLKGRNFDKNIKSDEEGVILNEAALKAIGWNDVENRQFIRGENRLNLLGVVKDYNYESLAVGVEPVFHIYRSEENAVHNYVSIKLASNNFAETVEYIKETFKELDTERNFEFNFIDESFARLYESEERMASIISYFTIIGIIIASLGLFALASLTVIRKRKEIGVRKVLGASTSKIVFSFTINFMKLTLAGIFVALPLSYYLLDEWLNDFAFRVALNPIWFISGSLAAIIISMLTVLYQAFKAANADPVNSLRNE
ncbi:MAG: ABC transporter permease [Bacteroidetes bacterium]|nr:ABC transporter permease [Bacteroidota bacterium]